MNFSPPPPPEAYSRVTNPERFAPITHNAAEFIVRVSRDFDVDVIEVPPQLPGQTQPQVTRTVLLRPASSDSAEIEISFSAFPGVAVKAGVGTTSTFPACGCDACSETAEEEVRRFNWMLQNVIEGNFTERIRGVFRKRFEVDFGLPAGSQRGFTVLHKSDPRSALKR